MGLMDAVKATAPASLQQETLPAVQVSSPKDAVYSLVTAGDLSKLSIDERMSYYKTVCEQVGLNPLTKPFDFIKLNGKLVLYANKDCAAQLARVHNLSTEITSKEHLKDQAIIMVWAKVTGTDKRSTEDVGCVELGATAKAEAAANAWMKAVTKARRRTILSHCGLGVLDESELDTIPSSKIQVLDHAPAIESAHSASGSEAQKVGQTVSAVTVDNPTTISGSADGAQHTTPLVDGDVFKYELQEHRQRLIKEIKARFADISRDNLHTLGSSYKSAGSWAAILADLDAHAARLKQ